MTSHGYSRKRPAPGADPVPYSQMQKSAPTYHDGLGPQLSNDQFLQWGQTGQPAGSYDDNSYAMNSNTYPQHNPQSQVSSSLTRRPIPQLTTRARMTDDSNQWADNSNGAVGAQDPEWGDDITELEAKAQVAKKEAQTKRKQIPPFVQKLNR